MPQSSSPRSTTLYPTSSKNGQRASTMWNMRLLTILNPFGGTQCSP
ncbi:hypothetical protein HMPREF9597_02078 [Cutibacterium acnes HL005PA4]|nr:hypothetical protein HMPREF9567_02001 [Cutibacterium acnes HL013PA1]EFS39585.1 hypothetical protein HMPREF9574_00011 [Cutibacterium acnes HL074PA1]EFS41880.1 hypothetical protein HMPREF9575_00147 [Cutibacterium acnes HL110PA1]EFS42499.1 hypothetical protein HMPREF9576_02129 [Cutibacterium acnes HL110PA2]EFS49169.1 hypothetical protein HMPREF9585_00466 [Cutibacterium acnes HL083PA1]EFS57357.1 hypothetical protein HMPREF9593_00245 [Cutibacterium acnes HL046PA2]EFS68909.1 hypothetical protein